MIRFACLLALVVFLEDVGADKNWGYGRRYWRKPSKPKCEPVKCDFGCVEEIDPSGCKKCVCAPVCPKLECPIDCTLEKLFPDSPCPSCKCDKKDYEDDDDYEEKAFDIRRHDVPACSPPKCRPGCQIETVFVGPCPGCKCPWDDVPSGPAGGRNKKIGQKSPCIPVKCEGPDCKLLKLDDKCPICECKPKCDPPKCGHGCTLEDDPKEPCPVCICKKEEEKIDVILDEKRIEEDMKKDCPEPKCPRRCKIEIEKDECPKCVCPKWFSRG